MIRLPITEVCNELIIWPAYENGRIGIGEIEIFDGHARNTDILKPFLKLEINGCFVSTYYARAREKQFSYNTYAYGGIDQLEYTILGGQLSEDDQIIADSHVKKVIIQVRGTLQEEEYFDSTEIVFLNPIQYVRFKLNRVPEYLSFRTSQIKHRLNYYYTYYLNHSFLQTLGWLLKKYKFSTLHRFLRNT